MEFPEGYSQLFTQRLNEIKNNFSYSWITFVAIRDASVGAAVSALKPLNIDNTLALPLDQLMASAKADPGVPDRFVWFVVRGALVVLYEAFKDDKARYGVVEKEDWFLLLASLRHSLSHGIDGNWKKIFPNNGQELKFTRRSDGQTFTLSTDLIGTGINFATFGSMPTAIYLFDAATEFARSLEPKV